MTSVNDLSDEIRRVLLTMLSSAHLSQEMKDGIVAELTEAGMFEDLVGVLAETALQLDSMS